MEKRINTNPHILHFVLKKNKYFPNSKLPVLIYKSAIDLPRQKNKASQITQKIFAANGWSNAWTNGIYDFHHYHSITHECMCVIMGSATVILGGPNGKKIKLLTGDVLILPAGVAHKCLKHSENFKCVGVYPQGKDYDINTGTFTEYNKAIVKIKKLSVPKKDPVLGTQGFLKIYWNKKPK
jgi:uncharacterized protein YjlB